MSCKPLRVASFAFLRLFLIAEIYLIWNKRNISRKESIFLPKSAYGYIG